MYYYILYKNKERVTYFYGRLIVFWLTSGKRLISNIINSVKTFTFTNPPGQLFFRTDFTISREIHRAPRYETKT